MFHPFNLFVWVGYVIVLFSCQQRKTVKVEPLTDTLNYAIRVIDSTSWHTSEALTIAEYQSWLKKQQGITFDILQNATYDAVMWYQPAVLDAAINAGNTTSEVTDTYTEHLKAKSNFHYINFEILYKDPSVNKVFNKEEFFGRLKGNLFFVKDQSDTLHSAIVEFFPSIMMGQPHHITVLIPATISFKSLTAGLKGEVLGFKRDLSIELSEQQYKSLPEIKL